MTSKIKLAALGGLILSFLSIMVHLFLAKSSASLVQYSAVIAFTEDLNLADYPTKVGPGYRRLWGNLKSLEPLQPYANPRSKSYPVPSAENNGFIYAKVHGGFESIRTSICDLVLVSRLLNATLVIPEIQESTQSKGISSKFKSFSYLFNEEKFISALASDVIIVKNLPPSLQEGRKLRQYPIFRPKISSSPSFYLQEVLPKLKKAKVIGLILADGGCLETNLPSSLVEYQRLRCRVAFHALNFREEIIKVARQMIDRLRGTGQPYLAYHPGLKRDTLAYHGCAELFQLVPVNMSPYYSVHTGACLALHLFNRGYVKDAAAFLIKDVHTELIQHRRAKMIKQGIIKEELSADSYARKGNGSCPLMPEEVGLLLRAMGYPPRTRIYLAGSETFGGPRVLIPLRALYANLVDRTSLCNKGELTNLVGAETPLPVDLFESPPAKSAKQLKEEWDNAGPRPRPLPPPPDRPIYRHEKEGWYGWIAEKDSEPDPTPNDLRDQAHHLLWDALDYIISVEADAFFPGFDNDGSGWPDFSGLVMGHRLYEMASRRTYRPDRKYLTRLFNSTRDNLYYHPRNFTLLVREHLNRSMTADGIIQKFHSSRSKYFLSHPIPECSCTTLKNEQLMNPNNLQSLYEGLDECPQGLEQSVKTVGLPENGTDETDMQGDEVDLGSQESDENSQADMVLSLEEDTEMDTND